MREPLAFFLTWTTYASWLPGDERGWIHRKESGVKSENAGVKKTVESRLSETAVKLSPLQRDRVDEVMREHATFRGWNILALNVRTNHVHLVIEADASPPEIIRQMKMWATRKLKQSHPDRSRWWTKQGDCRQLYSEEALENAVNYTLEGQ